VCQGGGENAGKKELKGRADDSGDARIGSNPGGQGKKEASLDKRGGGGGGALATSPGWGESDKKEKASKKEGLLKKEGGI